MEYIRIPIYFILQNGLGGVDLSVRVLTTGFWPTATTNSPCILPQIVSDAFAVFQKFYLSQYSGRQLTLQPHLVR